MAWIVFPPSMSSLDCDLRCQGCGCTHLKLPENMADSQSQLLSSPRNVTGIFQIPSSHPSLQGQERGGLALSTGPVSWVVLRWPASPSPCRFQFAKVAGVARACRSHGALCYHLMDKEGTGCKTACWDLGLEPAKFEFTPTLTSLGF